LHPAPPRTAHLTDTPVFRHVFQRLSIPGPFDPD
jgi:hypothetical protein